MTLHITQKKDENKLTFQGNSPKLFTPGVDFDCVRRLIL